VIDSATPSPQKAGSVNARLGLMRCNFVVEPKVGVDDRILVRRREQTEYEVALGEGEQ
jgi:hypothetical protein